jgi:hypothetical protein
MAPYQRPAAREKIEFDWLEGSEESAIFHPRRVGARPLANYQERSLRAKAAAA